MYDLDSGSKMSLHTHMVLSPLKYSTMGKPPMLGEHAPQTKEKPWETLGPGVWALVYVHQCMYTTMRIEGMRTEEMQCLVAHIEPQQPARMCTQSRTHTLVASKHAASLLAHAPEHIRLGHVGRSDSN